MIEEGLTVAGARHLARFNAPRSHWPNEGLFCAWSDVRAQLQHLLAALDMTAGDTPSMRAAVLEQADRALLCLGARTEKARANRQVILPAEPDPAMDGVPADVREILDAAEEMIAAVDGPPAFADEILPVAPPTPSRAERLAVEDFEAAPPAQRRGGGLAFETGRVFGAAFEAVSRWLFGGGREAGAI